VVARHETLRTTIINAEGRPLQIISAHQPVELPVLDLSHLPQDGRDAEAQRPFDLSVGPLIRHTLLRLGEREHILLVLTHHIISDGWSGGVFWQELAELY